MDEGNIPAALPGGMMPERKKKRPEPAPMAPGAMPATSGGPAGCGAAFPCGQGAFPAPAGGAAFAKG